MTADSSSRQGLSPQTPWEAIQSIARETVIIDERSFIISRPDQSDRLLEHPAVKSLFIGHNYLPYWADLWPAARMLAKVILREPGLAGQKALEVGCGLGLPGIAALAAGLHVTFSDCDATALRFAADNARLNGFHDFETLVVDWREPPSGLAFPVVLASDLIYELANVEPVVCLLGRVMAPGGICLLTDQDRVPSYEFRQALSRRGLSYTTQAVKTGEPGGRRVRGTLYRITRRDETGLLE